VFRFLTLVVQVPIGALSYVAWREHLRRNPPEVGLDAERLTA
jgi:hypothetical protein